MARKPHYRRGRRRKRGFATWSLGKKIAVILSSTLLAVLAIGTVILASKLSKIETTKLDAEKLNISEEVEHETGYVNVALFGLDSRENDLGKGNRSDTIMIASLNRETKEVKLVSVFRDTLLELDDGSFNKANAAYSFGGPEAAVSMLNRNLDMNIEKYVTVNFNALVDVIDALEISKAWTAIGGDFSTLRIQKAKFVVAIHYIERGKSDQEVISFIRKIWGLSIRVSELKDLIPFGKYLISKHLDSPF